MRFDGFLHELGFGDLGIDSCFWLPDLLKLALDKFPPIKVFVLCVDDFSEAWLQEPHGQLSCAALLLDEVNDFEALVGRERSEAFPCHFPHEIENLIVGGREFEDINSAQNRLKGVILLGNDVCRHDNSAVELKAGRHVVEVNRRVVRHHLRTLAPQRTSQQSENLEVTEDRIAIVQENDHPFTVLVERHEKGQWRNVGIDQNGNHAFINQRLMDRFGLAQTTNGSVAEQAIGQSARHKADMVAQQPLTLFQRRVSSSFDRD